MALTAADKKFIAGLIAQALVPTSAPAQVAASDNVAPTYFTGKDLKSGKGFACTADGGCGRLLKTSKRAAIHGVDAGGHTAA